MNEDELRKEFEEWAGGVHGLPVEKLILGTYRSIGTYDAWCAWKASRETLCVSLPKPFGSSTMCNDFVIYGEVEKALDKAGVKYK